MYLKKLVRDKNHNHILTTFYDMIQHMNYICL